MVAWAEEMLTAHSADPTMVVFDSCIGAVGRLRASGYAPVDTMTVLLSEGPVESAGRATATVHERPAADRWARAYLEAFYGDEELAPRIVPIVTRLLRLDSVTLLEARAGGDTAGVLALFRTRGLAGVYCVGTVPGHRRKGVAGTLLSRAKAIAEDERRRLVLQALASDGSIRYFLKRGFKALYSKQLMSKESSNAKEKEHL